MPYNYQAGLCLSTVPPRCAIFQVSLDTDGKVHGVKCSVCNDSGKQNRLVLCDLVPDDSVSGWSVSKVALERWRRHNSDEALLLSALPDDTPGGTVFKGRTPKENTVFRPGFVFQVVDLILGRERTPMLSFMPTNYPDSFSKLIRIQWATLKERFATADLLDSEEDGSLLAKLLMMVIFTDKVKNSGLLANLVNEKRIKHFFEAQVLGCSVPVQFTTGNGRHLMAQLRNAVAHESDNVTLISDRDGGRRSIRFEDRVAPGQAPHFSLTLTNVQFFKLCRYLTEALCDLPATATPVTASPTVKSPTANPASSPKDGNQPGASSFDTKKGREGSPVASNSTNTADSKQDGRSPMSPLPRSRQTELSQREGSPTKGKGTSQAEQTVPPAATTKSSSPAAASTAANPEGLKVIQLGNRPQQSKEELMREEAEAAAKKAKNRMRRQRKAEMRDALREIKFESGAGDRKRPTPNAQPIREASESYSSSSGDGSESSEAGAAATGKGKGRRKRGGKRRGGGQGKDREPATATSSEAQSVGQDRRDVEPSSAKGSKRPGPCFEFRKQGSCRFGADCKFTHIGTEGSTSSLPGAE
jgi:hypothetical protein